MLREAVSTLLLRANNLLLHATRKAVQSTPYVRGRRSAARWFTGSMQGIGRSCPGRRWPTGGSRSTHRRRHRSCCRLRRLQNTRAGVFASDCSAYQDLLHRDDHDKLESMHFGPPKSSVDLLGYRRSLRPSHVGACTKRSGDVRGNVPGSLPACVVALGWLGSGLHGSLNDAQDQARGEDDICAREPLGYMSSLGSAGLCRCPAKHLQEVLEAHTGSLA